MYAVVIPAYNHRPFLLDCVLSAVRSSLVSEILLVDDGSVDRTGEVLPFISAIDSRIRLLEDRPSGNRGAPARLNQLVEAAREQWVSVLNSDDLFAAERFDAIDRAVVRECADLFFGDLVLIDGDGNRTGLRNAIRHNEIPWPLGWDAEALADRGDWLTLLGVQNIIATTTNIVFNKKLFERVGGFRNYRYCHDWDFAIRCAIEGRIRYAPLMLSMYRSHATNTIKERRDAVEIEVREMFRNLLTDYPQLSQQRGFREALRFNPYNPRSPGCALAVVLPPSSPQNLVRELTANEDLDVRFVTQGDMPPGARYIYAPTEDPCLLSPTELRNLLLAIELRPYDAFLISRTAEPYPIVGAKSLADLAVLRADAPDWPAGNVRVLRSYTVAADPRPIGDFVDLANAAVDTASAESPAHSQWGPAADILRGALGISRSTLATVFVLPAFLALGGVERVIVDTMTHLQDRYRFVVVCTEPLRAEQGSLHREAAAVSYVYDLAEIACVEDRLKAMRLLKERYLPLLVWTCNGSPWQIQHSAAIREIFSDVPIVDNQAYDHEQGWIQCYDQAGVKAADRFVAITRRIQQTMISRYAIPADRIDLVYPGFNPTRTLGLAHPTPTQRELRTRFGLQSALPVFGMIGRLTTQKRPLDLVRLAERLQRIDYPAQFVWVGSGELEPDFVALAEGLGVQNIKLISAQRDVQPVIAMLSGLLITSAYEGLPVIMLEALSLGVPVLSTDVGAIAELLDRYGSGMIFRPVGDIDALERAFCTFVGALEKFRQNAAQSAPVLVEDFSSARMAREYHRCFQAAIARFQCPAPRDPSPE